MPKYKNNNKVGVIWVTGLDGSPVEVKPGEDIETNFQLDLTLTDLYSGLTKISEIPVPNPWVKVTAISGTTTHPLHVDTKSYLIGVIGGTGSVFFQTTDNTPGMLLAEKVGTIQEWVYDSANRKKYDTLEFVEDASFTCYVYESDSEERRL